MTRRFGLCVSLAVILGCSPFDHDREATHFRSLYHRCILVRIDTVVLIPASGQHTAQPYLDKSASTIDKVIARVPAGTTISITRVLYETRFESTAVVALAKIPGVEGDTDISLLFSAAWMLNAISVEEGSPDEAPRVSEGDALNARVAEWCSTPSH